MKERGWQRERKDEREGERDAEREREREKERERKGREGEIDKDKEVLKKYIERGRFYMGR